MHAHFQALASELESSVTCDGKYGPRFDRRHRSEPLIHGAFEFHLPRESTHNICIHRHTLFTEVPLVRLPVSPLPSLAPHSLRSPPLLVQRRNEEAR